ncbi:hypothetical protein [Streptomyces sp. NPDC057257]|uniref:hypothetical protein n=1 Tax=Streptomyces sp. NPDC057257 TaxID=3346071 RepID=UPI0036440652
MYDFVGAGRSELDPKLPQEAPAPTNCGEVRGAAVGSVPVGGIETGSAPAAAGMPWGMVLGTGAGAPVMAAGVFVVTRRRLESLAGAVRLESLAGAVAETRGRRVNRRAVVAYGPAVDVSAVL